MSEFFRPRDLRFLVPIAIALAFGHPTQRVAGLCLFAFLTLRVPSDPLPVKGWRRALSVLGGIIEAVFGLVAILAAYWMAVAGV